MGSDLEAVGRGRAREGCEFPWSTSFTNPGEPRFSLRIALMLLASMFCVFAAGCSGSDDLKSLSNGRENIRGRKTPNQAAESAHHLADVPLEKISIPESDQARERFIVKGPAGNTEVVRVGDLVGSTKARVDAVYTERVLLDEPVSGGTYRVVMERDEAGRTKMFRVMPIDTYKKVKRGASVAPVLQKQKMEQPQSESDRAMGK